MKRIVWLLCGALGLGCSAAGPSAAGGGSAPAAAGSAAQSAAGSSSSGSGGLAVGGAGGAPNVGGAANAGTSGSVSGVAGASAGASVGGGAGSAGTASAGAGGGSGCVPDAAGSLSLVGDTVHDGKSCLDWMKTTKTGVNYEAAQMYCADATLGGFDDWRIPSASEFASTVTLCGKYLPEGPIDTKFFDEQGDGYWTTTPAAEPNKICAVGMLNAGGYYHYGTAGPQVVRCVRGAGSVKMVKDCTTAQGCTDW